LSGLKVGREVAVDEVVVGRGFEFIGVVVATRVLVVVRVDMEILDEVIVGGIQVLVEDCVVVVDGGGVDEDEVLGVP